MSDEPDFGGYEINPGPSFFARSLKFITDLMVVFGVALFAYQWAFADTYMFAERLTHLALQAFLVCWMVPLLYLIIGYWKFALAGMLLPVVGFIPLAPYLFPHQVHDEAMIAQAAKKGMIFRIVSHNLLISNSQYQETLTWTFEQKPDIIFYSESTPTWVHQFYDLERFYPHKLLRPEEHPFGIAVYSKLPFAKEPVAEDFETGGLWTAFCEFDLPDREENLLLVGLHPIPSPIQERDMILQKIAEKVAAHKGPVITVGDFNTTPYSPAWRNFLRVASLDDSMKGMGLNPTWKAGLPWFMQIPIDLGAARGPAKIVKIEQGPDVGSDHIPLVFTVSIPHPSKEAP